MAASSNSGAVTQILQRITRGENQAFDELLPLVYEELQRIAGRHMDRMGAGHTLQPTALVHEACIKMLGQQHYDWHSRSHFLNAASRAMRHVLVDHARKRMRQKRGGERARESQELLDGLAAPGGLSVGDLLALDEALELLHQRDARKAQVIELRYFGGLSSAETARVLDVDRKTVHRDRVFALAWLNREMNESGSDDGSTPEPE